MKATGREFEPRLEQQLFARVTQWSEWWSYERLSFAFGMNVLHCYCSESLLSVVEFDERVVCLPPLKWKGALFVPAFASSSQSAKLQGGGRTDTLTAI